LTAVIATRKHAASRRSLFQPMARKAAQLLRDRFPASWP